MNISLILSILIFSMLVFIAAELYVIARELSRGITLVIKDREKNEGKSSGQTINVNVAPTGAGTQNVTPTPLCSLGIKTDNENDDDDDSEEEIPVQNKKPDPPRASSGGALSIKCSRCKSENSSYRHECFNCGERL